MPIAKWIETYEVSEVNIDMEHVWRPRELKGKGRVFRLAHPIACVIDKQDDLFFSDDDFLGIVAWGNSREDVIHEYCEEFATLWDGIANEEDSRLTHDALHLKQKLLDLVRKVEPHGDSESPGDRRGLE